ncbi:hypothetical protein ES703_66042 [subsurface metagenome]
MFGMTKVKHQGASRIIVIPKDLADFANLQVGDKLMLRGTAERIVISKLEFALKKSPPGPGRIEEEGAALKKAFEDCSD